MQIREKAKAAPLCCLVSFITDDGLRRAAFDCGDENSTFAISHPSVKGREDQTTASTTDTQEKRYAILNSLDSRPSELRKIYITKKNRHVFMLLFFIETRETHFMFS